MESESPAEDVSGVITWNDTMTVRRYGKWTGELLSVETRSLKDVQKVRFDESDIGKRHVWGGSGYGTIDYGSYGSYDSLR